MLVEIFNEIVVERVVFIRFILIFRWFFGFLSDRGVGVFSIF